jgi:8-oxo-dGTP pyrophosphatase MutT (NUDIX family)
VNLRHRVATRAVVLDPTGKILLFLSHFDPGSGLPPQWVFPGGGLESGEQPIAGIVREVFEETGRLFAACDFEPITSFSHSMDDQRFHDTGESHFFELRVKKQFEPSSENWTENEHRDNVMHRWVSVSEILMEQLWVRPEGSIDLLVERYGDS